MIFRKQVLDHIHNVYAVSTCMVAGRRKLLAASEGREGVCRMYDAENGEFEVTVWEGPGGTMSMVPIPGRGGEFLATQRFFPVFDARESIVVHAEYQPELNRWKVREVQKIPYLHRFDVIKIQDQLVFIGGILCRDKQEVQDWSKPGELIVGYIPETIQGEWQLRTICSGITRHHGYYLQPHRNRFFVSGTEGLFSVSIPETLEGAFEVERVMDREISDMAVWDIDGDGTDEIATIEEFHGDELVISKQVDGQYIKVFSHPIAFGHVIWGGCLQGQSVFLVGSRRGTCALECITWGNGKYAVNTLDAGVGPTQLTAFTHHSMDSESGIGSFRGSEGDDQPVYLLTANRQQEEVALYTIESEGE